MNLIEPIYFDNALYGSFCDEIIEIFELSPGKIIRNNERYSFKELLMSNSDLLNSLQMKLIETANEYVNLYKAQNNINHFPDIYGYEGIRIKRYDHGDEFPWHADVMDYQSARRFLVCMFYLNDNFIGGETDFGSEENIDYTISPKQGRIVLFTPFWNNPHRGRKILNGSKYIANVYLHHL